jgi:hypothetical protein
MNIPEGVDPMVILGNDKNYLVVYTCLPNQETLELLKRSIQVLEYEDKLAEQFIGILNK